MAMLLTCQNQGCGEIDYHRLDEATNEVICTKCNQPVSVSKYAKNALKTMKQVVKKVKSDFEMTCPNCNAIDSPALKKYGKLTMKVVCKQCQTVNEHLSKYFIEALKMKPGIEVFQASKEELEAMGIKSVNKFNPVPTNQQNVITIQPPTEESPERVRVEYYKEQEGAENSQPEPQNEEQAVEVQQVQPSKPKPPAEPKNKVGNEKNLRARIENMPAKITTHPAPQPPGFTLNDMLQTGVQDYAGDVED